MSKLEHMKSLYRIHGSIIRLFDLDHGTPADELYDIIMNEMDIEETLSEEEHEAVHAFCAGLNEADDAERAKDEPLKDLIKLIDWRGSDGFKAPGFSPDAPEPCHLMSGGDGSTLQLNIVLARTGDRPLWIARPSLVEVTAGGRVINMSCGCTSPPSPNVPNAWRSAAREMQRVIKGGHVTPRLRKWNEIASEWFKPVEVTP